MTVNTNLTEARCRTSAASPPLNRVFTGTNTAPARSAPREATTHCQQFGAQTATRSPGPMPEATTALAHSSTASPSSA